MKYKELEGIGLTKGEIVVYISLLKIGQSSTGEIIKRSRISASKVYHILDRLIAKGLVGFVLKNNVKNYSALSPDKLKDYIKEKQREISEKERVIDKLIPDLKKIKESTGEEFSTEIYSGFNGFKSIILDLAKNMNKSSEFLSLGGSGTREEEIDIIWSRVTEELKRRKIKSRAIMTDISEVSKKSLRKFKYLELTYKFLAGFDLAPILIVENKVLIINFKELNVVLITSETISKQFRFFFNSLWKIARGD